MTRSKEFSLQRTLSVTAEMLVERGTDNASISEIASLAHCSTSTIYDAFTSKEELFYQAVLHYQGENRSAAPTIGVPAADEHAFEMLLDYLERRIVFLSCERSRGGFLAIMMQGERAPKLSKAVEESRIQLHRLVQVVEGAMRAGYLRDANPQSTAYCISAAVSFEPFAANVMRRERISVDDVLDQALDPFVTPIGRSALSALLTNRENRTAKDFDDRPRVRSWLRRA